jgi:hypothetical protein
MHIFIAGNSAEGPESGPESTNMTTETNTTKQIPQGQFLELAIELGFTERIDQAARETLEDIQSDPEALADLLEAADAAGASSVELL